MSYRICQWKFCFVNICITCVVYVWKSTHTVIINSNILVLIFQKRQTSDGGSSNKNMLYVRKLCRNKTHLKMFILEMIKSGLFWFHSGNFNNNDTPRGPSLIWAMWRQLLTWIHPKLCGSIALNICHASVEKYLHPLRYMSRLNVWVFTEGEFDKSHFHWRFTAETSKEWAFLKWMLTDNKKWIAYGNVVRES